KFVEVRSFVASFLGSPFSSQPAFVPAIPLGVRLTSVLVHCTGIVTRKISAIKRVGVIFEPVLTFLEGLVTFCPRLPLASRWDMGRLSVRPGVKLLYGGAGPVS